MDNASIQGFFYQTFHLSDGCIALVLSQNVHIKKFIIFKNTEVH